MTFRWLMKYFQIQQWRTRSNFKGYESEKNSSNYEGNKKVRDKKKRNNFYERIKSISATNNSTPTNSAPALSKTSSLSNTVHMIVGT